VFFEKLLGRRHEWLFAVAIDVDVEEQRGKGKK
jgi:hypothetical protein